MSRTPGRSPGAVALAGVYGLLLLSALRPGVAQDFLPSYVAAQSVASGRVDAVYLSPDARHLFDSPPAFVEASIAAGGEAVSPENVTAFVAPPTSLLPVLPLALLPYPVAESLWSLGLAVLAIASLQKLLRRRDGPLAERSGTLWALGTLGAAPILWYAVDLGQSAVLLLGAAAFFEPDRSRPRIGFCALLASAVVFKAFPVLLLGFLWLMGRRSEVAWTVAFGAAWTALAAVLLPVELLPAFLDGLGAVSGGVVTVWNNLSLDAFALRLETGVATAWFRDLTLPARLATGAVKGVILLLAGLIAAGRTGAAPTRRWAAAWAATLTLSPLLWAHYLVVLPALLGERTPREARLRAVLLAASGLWLLLELSGLASAATVGNLGSVLWLVIAGALLLPGLHRIEASAGA